MDDSLYNTSWTLYTIPILTSSFRALFVSSSNPSHLDRHAQSFRDTLGRDRPRYEDEEEKEKLGGLRSCTWTRLPTFSRQRTTNGAYFQAGARKRKRDTESDDTVALERGLLISLVYEKATYKFIVFIPQSQDTTAAKRNKTSTLARPTDGAAQVAIVLAKASAAALKAFQSYMLETFAITDVYALKLPPATLQTTLVDYMSSVYTDLSERTSQRQLPLDLKAIIGTLKLTMSFSAPVAPMLKTLDFEIPSESVRAALKNVEEDDDRSNNNNLMEIVNDWVYKNTGMKLATTMHKVRDDADRSEESGTNDQVNGDIHGLTEPSQYEPPMRISRVMSAAYAISTEGRLKFSSKAAEVCDSGGGRGDNVDDTRLEEDNVVRRANEALLLAVMAEARRQKEEEA